MIIDSQLYIRHMLYKRLTTCFHNYINYRQPVIYGYRQPLKYKTYCYRKDKQRVFTIILMECLDCLCKIM